MDTFTKQPGETLDYDFDFNDFMPSGDLISSVTVSADAGITLGAKMISSSTNTVKQFISCGTNGEAYKVTCVMTTTGGRVKEAEFKLKIKEQ